MNSLRFSTEARTGRYRYGQWVIVESHWWNGEAGVRRRRDVFIRTDGERWEVEARVGGTAGRSKVHLCPGRQSAEILAGAWMGADAGWKPVEV